MDGTRYFVGSDEVSIISSVPFPARGAVKLSDTGAVLLGGNVYTNSTSDAGVPVDPTSFTVRIAPVEYAHEGVRVSCRSV